MVQGGIIMANLAHLWAIAGSKQFPAHLVVRKVGPADIREALTKGLDDFWAMPSHIVFLGLFYPIAGLCIFALTSDQNALPLIFPLMSGFALIGPFAAIGLYEVSRRRELGLDASWQHAFAVLRSPSIPSILALGLLLMVIFIVWLATAQLLYQWLFGPTAPDSYLRFLTEVLTTSKGLTLILLGNALGFVFAVLVLSISVISFPLLLDRDVGVAVALETSFRAVLANPVTMTLWGLIIAAALAIGTLALFAGLAIIVPVLGHATWHFYRRVIEPTAPSGLDA
jgi:uncharacterized membrane protein